MKHRAVKRVLLMAGGSGGHIMPALAVADILMAQGIQVGWLGRAEGLEADLIQKKPEIIYYAIPVKPVRGQASVWSKCRRIGVLISAVWRSFLVLRQFRPDVVCGFGGYVSVPGGIAAWCSRIPLLIHEQNKIAGMANRYLSKLASYVCESFPNTFKRSNRLSCTGNPIRAAIAGLLEPQERQADVHIGVLGGSQGAQSLNELVPLVLAQLNQAYSIAVWHQTGTAMFTDVQQKYHDLNLSVTVSEFIQDMANFYAWTDIIITRSGATTLAEITAAGVASILIPYPHSADNHQVANALFLVNQGGAIIREESTLTPDSLSSDIRTLLDEPVRLSMAIAAKAISRPNAAECIVSIILKGM